MPAPEPATSPDYDLVVIGGGLAGASLAVALGIHGLRIGVVEAIEFDAGAQPSFDERTIALTYSARHIFEQLAVWSPALEPEACAIDSIHISNRGHFGMTHLDRGDVGTNALGYVVPTRALGRALMQRLDQLDCVDYLCPCTASAVETDTDGATVTIDCEDDDRPPSIRARLVVIADGGRSPLLATLGFERQSRAYDQSALLSIVRASQPHRHRAYERFMADGPLALLPMHDQRYAVVWTLAPDRLTRMQSLDDEEFIAALQQAFGHRAGQFSAPSPRKAYPLARSTLATPWQNRILALGNAAHTVHPVAGQGFNLGLRDIALLAEMILQVDKEAIGSAALLEAYAARRRLDTQRVVGFTDSLLHIFTHRSPLVRFSRNLGLVLVENLPPLKRALLKRTMGLSHHQPRLARGLRLKTGSEHEQ